MRDDASPRAKKSAKKSVRGRLPSGKPNPVDVHIGKRLRLRRILAGVSQEELSQAVGLTFQQIQKYEYGLNRMSTSRLWELSRVLNCPVGFFFEEMDRSVADSSPRHVHAGSVDVAMPENTATKREALMLVRAYYTIKEERVRRHILDLANSLGGQYPGEQDAEAPPPA